MSMVKVLIDGDVHSILESKLAYFQEALGAELLEEVEEQPKKKSKPNNKPKKDK